MVSWLFGKGPEHYTEKLLAALHESVTASGEEEAKARATVERSVSKLKAVLYGEEDKAPKEDQCDKLSKAWQDHDVPLHMLHHIRVLGFEVRKDMSLCITALTLNDTAGFRSVYLAGKPNICRDLVDGYADSQTALAVGPMLRACMKEPSLQAAMLRGIPGEAPPPALLPRRTRKSTGEATKTPSPAGSPTKRSGEGGGGEGAAAGGGGGGGGGVAVDESPPEGLGGVLLELMRRHVHAPQFEVGADAFQSLQALLTTNPEEVRGFLVEKHDVFFEEYGAMLERANFSTLRQALKLLGELLLDRSNFEVMIRFVGDRNQLRRIMMMLRDRREAVQIEAFHVFKIFCANPEAPPEIVEVLLANRVKLVKFLRELGNDRDDEEFAKEKALLVDTIENRLVLPDDYVRTIPTKPSAPAPASTS